MSKRYEEIAEDATVVFNDFLLSLLQDKNGALVSELRDRWKELLTPPLSQSIKCGTGTANETINEVVNRINKNPQWVMGIPPFQTGRDIFPDNPVLDRQLEEIEPRLAHIYTEEDLKEAFMAGREFGETPSVFYDICHQLKFPFFIDYKTSKLKSNENR